LLVLHGKLELLLIWINSAKLPSASPSEQEKPPLRLAAAAWANSDNDDAGAARRYCLRY
jgi:hypothetical protein